jgi:hypothetical protein
MCSREGGWGREPPVQAFVNHFSQRQRSVNVQRGRIRGIRSRAVTPRLLRAFLGLFALGPFGFVDQRDPCLMAVAPRLPHRHAPW